MDLNTMPIIRLLLVDQSEIFIQRIQSELDSHENIQLVAHATQTHNLLSLCAENAPHIIMIGQVADDSLDVIRAIRKQNPEARIIAVANQIDVHHARQHLNAGVSGYLLQNDVLDCLSDSIWTAHQGKAVISTDVTRALL
jgi:two-component system NarL family response regulator